MQDYQALDGVHASVDATFNGYIELIKTELRAKFKAAIRELTADWVVERWSPEYSPLESVEDKTEIIGG